MPVATVPFLTSKLMNHNKISQPRKRWQVTFFALICLLVFGGIIFLKRTSVEQRGHSSGWNNAPSAQVAVPDTTVSPDVLPVTPDTVAPSVLPDTILGKDTRDPFEAGYEDGYLSGCDDGAMEQEQASYDDSNTFRSATARQEYVRGYREGYAKGYDDGLAGHQFNIQ